MPVFLKSMRREGKATDRQIAMRDSDAITITKRESEFENRVESREEQKRAYRQTDG
jgi:hypothetical protein